MTLRDSCKEHYVMEGTRRNDLTVALSLPSGVLSIVLGALVLMAKELHLPLGSVEWLHLALMAFSACACGLCTYFLFRSLYGLAYAYVPTSMQLMRYREQLLAFHLNSGSAAAVADGRAEGEALDYLYEEYAKNADRNATNNDIKSAFLHKANGAIIAAVVLAAAAGVTYVCLSIASPPLVQKVEVVNALNLHHTGALLPMQTAPNPPRSPAPTPPPAPSVRPEPPPSRVVREHVNPPNPTPAPHRR